VSPVARPLALPLAPRKPSTFAASAAISAATPVRVSARQLARIAADLTPVDRSVLAAVHLTRLCLGSQLQRLFFGPGDANGRAARRTLKRLSDWRVIDALPRRIGGVRAGSAGIAYLVGPVGARLLALEGARTKRFVTPGDRFVAHTLAVAEVYVRLHEAHQSRALELLDIETEPSCWRPYPGPLGAPMVLKPDLFVRLGAGAESEDRWFVEVDQATEGRGSIARKLGRYAAHFASGEEQSRHGAYPRVVWAVPHVRRASWLHELLESGQTQAPQLHTVTTHEALVPLLASEARA